MTSYRRINGRQMSRTKGARHLNFDVRMNQVKNFIREYHQVHHYSPSLTEIAVDLHIGKTVVYYYVNELTRLGWLAPRPHGQARSYVPANLEELQNDPIVDQQTA